MAEREPSSSAPSQPGQDDSSSVLGEVLVNQRSLRTGPEVRGASPTAESVASFAQSWLQRVPGACSSNRQLARGFDPLRGTRATAAAAARQPLPPPPACVCECGPYLPLP